MHGAITPLPNTPLWRGVQLKKAQGQIYLLLFPLPLASHIVIPAQNIANYPNIN
jgi:hypothetical protein